MITIVALTEPGLLLAKRIDGLLKSNAALAIKASEKQAGCVSQICYKPKPFSATVQQAFQSGDALILICATGIAVRTLASVLDSKLTDPPVLVLDEAGQFIIPLLSGHEGGANDWADKLANALSAQLVMTTAKPYIDPIYSVGMGCERNCPVDKLDELLQQCLQKADLNIEQISHINSIDIKADEVGLIELAKRYSKPFMTWDKIQLRTVEDQLSTKSDYVFGVVGVYGVAESAALLDAKIQTQQTPELLLNKHKSAVATCAIARAYPLADQSNRKTENRNSINGANI